MLNEREVSFLRDRVMFLSIQTGFCNKSGVLLIENRMFFKEKCNPYGVNRYVDEPRGKLSERPGDVLIDSDRLFNENGAHFI